MAAPAITAEQQAAGFTALHAAAHAGAVQVVIDLLAAGAADVASTLTAQGDSALHLSALGGHDAVMHTLLTAAPALLTQKNNMGWTPLMLSVLSPAPPSRRVRCARLLLDMKADPLSAAAEGWNAPLLAAQRGDAATLGLMLTAAQPGVLLAKTADGDGALHLAAHAGSAACVRLLVAAGAPLESRNRHGMGVAELAIHAACSHAAPPRGGCDDDSGADGFCTVLRLLVAAGSPLAPACLGRLAVAAPDVPGWRLLTLCVILRRAGLVDNHVGASEAAGGAAAGGGSASAAAAAAAASAAGGGSGDAGLASARAEARGRPELAAVLRAPRACAGPLLCLRTPIEAEAPALLLVAEGARAAPEPGGESQRLQAALRALHRVANLSIMQAPGASAAATAAAQEGGMDAAAWDELMLSEAASDAAQRLAAAAGGGGGGGGGSCGGGRMPRTNRLFRRVGEASSAAEGVRADGSAAAAPAPHRVAHTWRTQRRRAPPPLASLVARASAEHAAAAAAAAAAAGGAEGGAGGASEAAASAAAALDAVERAGPLYRMARRWETAEGVEVVELRPEANAPVVHERHLELLRAALGDAMVDGDLADLMGQPPPPPPGGAVATAAESAESAAERPWALYVEDAHAFTASAVDDAGGGGGGGAEAPAMVGATVECFSLDAALLLSFVTDGYGGEARSGEAGGDDDDDDDDEAMSRGSGSDSEDMTGMDD